MQTIDKPFIVEILNLKGSPLISSSIADRQLEVIRRGFNHLMQEDNNVLYIADEVGLGKTYIALGIASLLRHFSLLPESYQDMIIVPKANLQYKWEKEIKQFISKNYLLPDNRVKSIIGSPVGEIIQKKYLEPIHTDHPAYHIYRNSQFSLAFNWRSESKKQQLQTLLDRLTNQRAKNLFQTAIDENYFDASNKSYLKKLYAYLLSICHPEIELLIVDEGHNYKYGLGEGDDDEVSDRNNVVTRFLGLKRNTDEDKEIFEQFPELKRLVQPKVKKLIILSATPKTERLAEIKNQLDCFLPHHILSGLKTEDDIKYKLPFFLMRGNMEYAIGGKIYTRNLCRYEHRLGNVEKDPEAPALSLKDNEQAIVLGLLQYNTIKHLQAKNNASFELGMLAGFETFQVDQVKRAITNESENNTKEDPEYEESRTTKVRRSQDYEVVKTIVESYKNKFGCLPPHPKQDAIVEATFQMMKKGEKSLIFVRRVASADELERRLLDKWEAVVFEELSEKWMKKYPSIALRQMINCHKEHKENRELAEKVDTIVKGIIEKFINNTSYPFSFITSSKSIEEIGIIGLYFIYNNHGDIDENGEWYTQLSKNANLKFIKRELVDLSYSLLERNFNKWKNLIESNEEAGAEGEPDSYYFHNYFSQAINKSFKNRLSSTDWFDLNYFKLNQHFKIASFNLQALRTEEVNKQIRPGNEMKEVQEYFRKHIEENEYEEINFSQDDLHPQYNKTTLLTELFILGCEKEMENFINNLGVKTKSSIFEEIELLSVIIKTTLRNGAGFLPLFIADKNEGEMIESYLSIISDEDSVFYLVLQEMKTIIRDYSLIRAVNFPEGETVLQMQTKLFSQTPALGLTGQSKRNKSTIAAQFRMPGFPYVLITTDIFREGEDLHTYCQNIYHYGIAWNCSDMEQRTGRIDRINSMSHRKMELNSSVQFDERVHVFYPYVKQTLEVNQVNKLFSSINSFVETFNDFTEPIHDDGIATTKDAISDLPQVIEKTLHSKFEHNYFMGYDEAEKSIQQYSTIGMQKIELLTFLSELVLLISNNFSFHFGPQLNKQSFKIVGDIKMEKRKNRRGPFVISIKNSVYPGRFCVESASHIFKTSNKMQRLVKDKSSQLNQYTLGNIGEFYALTFETPVEEFNYVDYVKKLSSLITAADEIEDELSEGKQDNVIFG